jgi:hypothetical protein
MKVTVVEQRKINSIEVSTAVTIETKRGELSKAEIIAVIQILLQQEGKPAG